MNKRQKLVQQQFLNDEKAVIKRLNQVYSKSLTDINDKVKNLTFTIDKLQQEYDWMDPNDPKKAQVKSMIQSKIYQKQYQEQLQKQVDGILKQMHTSEFVAVSDYLDKCYEDGFIGTIFDAHGQGVPIITPIDQEAMVRAVQLDSKISKGLYTRLGEDVNLLKKKITAQVSRSIATGMTYAQTAKALENYTRIGYNNSIRIARTEGHRVQTTATMDAMEKAKEKGAEILKQWDSTLDDSTRESHVAVDGEIRELDKPFSNGLMFPGDPSGAAAEVINCRCALLQRARWAIEGDDKSFTKLNNFTKQIQEFDSPEDYGEFKKGFFAKENKQYMNYVGQIQDKYGTRDFSKLLDRMSEREYKHYSKLLKKNPVYNKDTTYKSFKRIGTSHSIVDDIGTKDNPICNPNYSKGGDYRLNCGYCSATYEMRRRGYDVIANPKHTMYVSDWKKLFNGCTPIPLKKSTTNVLMTDLQEKLSKFGDGARGSLFVQWKTGTVGHFFSWEVKNGQVLFIDGQNGNIDTVDYFKYIRPTKTVCLRWDDLEPSDMIMDACKNRGAN